MDKKKIRVWKDKEMKFKDEIKGVISSGEQFSNLEAIEFLKKYYKDYQITDIKIDCRMGYAFSSCSYSVEHKEKE